MRPTSRSPILYQINTRVWLNELSGRLGRPATLDDIPDAALDTLAGMGFEWVWLLSVWEIGTLGRQLSLKWRDEYRVALPDLRDDDIIGSGFAIAGYDVPRALGGDEALARIRERLRQRGIRLMLDFVPNHTAIDHPWVHDRPDYYVAGTAFDLASQPHNYTRVADGGRVLAYGRDPHFPGWSDTLQLDYSNPATQAAMAGELLRIAQRCDGVRCDMAMLLMPEVFAGTWGRPAQPFWPDAIRHVRDRFPAFCLMAEVYWDLEWPLLSQGFDYAYDKRLYDRLRDGDAGPVRAHLRAESGFQLRLARFLENHDEPRAAAAFPRAMHEAAAIVTYLSAGLRFFHEGQFEGRLTRIPVQLGRRPIENVDEGLLRFYAALRSILQQPVFRDGDYRLLDCTPASEHNGTWDRILAWAWTSAAGERRLVTVNYAPQASQCVVRLPFEARPERPLRFVDLMGPLTFDRDPGDLAARGLDVDLPAWGYHVFDVTVR